MILDVKNLLSGNSEYRLYLRIYIFKELGKKGKGIVNYSQFYLQKNYITSFFIKILLLIN